MQSFSNTHQIKQQVKPVHHTHVNSTSHIIIIFSLLQIDQINSEEPIELVYLGAK